MTDGHWLAVVLCVYWIIRLVSTRKKQLLIISVIVGLLALGSTLVQEMLNKSDLLIQDKVFVIEPELGNWKVDGNQLQFYGDVIQAEGRRISKEQVIVFYRFQSQEEKEKWEEYPNKATLAVTGELKIPEANRNNYQFNYREFLYRKKTHWILTSSTLQIVEKSHQPSFIDVILLKDIRRKTLLFVDERISGKAGGYIKTLLLGDNTSLEGEILDGYKQLGIVHLLSISGLHVQFLLSGLGYILLRTGITKERTYLVMMIVSPIYGGLSGWGVSVFRAITVQGILQTADRFHLPVTGLDAWSYALIMAIMINPYQLFNIGFQLSFLLSLTLLLIPSCFMERKKNRFSKSLMVSFLLMLMSVPVLSYHFFEFSWIGVFANLLFVPVFTWVLLPLLILLFCISFVLPEIFFLQILTEGLNDGIRFLESTILQINAFPFSSIVTGRMPFFVTLLVVLCIVAFWMAKERNKGKSNPYQLVVLLILLASVFYQPYSPFGEVVVIDIGQGDAILIKEPFGEGNFLIDTGGVLEYQKEEWEVRKNASTVASRVLIPVLKSEGVSRLNEVIVTHGDEDHMGALLELSKTVKIDKLVYPKGTLKKENFSFVADEIRKTGTRLEEVVANQKRPPIVGPSLAVLWPWQEGSGENNDSIVLYGKLGNYTWLFTGDLEESGETKLIGRYPNLSADILKVGHHGSSTSSSQQFLQTVQPKVALVSVGLNNRYGHPNQGVLDRLDKLNVVLYRSDLDGAIRFRYPVFFPASSWEDLFETTLKREEEK